MKITQGDLFSIKKDGFECVYEVIKTPNLLKQVQLPDGKTETYFDLKPKRGGDKLIVPSSYFLQNFKYWVEE